MAQVTGGSHFDEVWEEWSNVSLTLIREAADRFAHSGENALAPEVVATAFLSVLATPRPANFRWSRPKWPPRFFDGAYQPPLAVESFEKLAPSQQQGNWVNVVADIAEVISVAAREWALGNPEQPNSREILNELLGLLWSRRLIPRPPAKSFPRGI